MKFPKLINGATPAGESFARALDQTDAPFITYAGVNSTAQKKGGVTEVRQKTGMRYLFFTMTFPNGGGSSASYGTLDHSTSLITRFGHKQEYSLGAFRLIGEGALRLVGDGYIMMCLASTADRTSPDGYCWPILVRAATKQTPETLSEEAAGRLVTTSFADELQFGGFPLNAMSLHTFATGAAGARGQGYSAGVAGLWAQNPASPTTSRAPRAYTFNTRTKAVYLASIPYYVDRDHCSYAVCTTGRGKAQGLVLVREEVDYDDSVEIDEETFTYIYMKTKRAPYLISSTDHGRNFSLSTATWLEPRLYKHGETRYPGDTTIYDRERYENPQLEAMGKGACIFYIGNGQNMLFIPNGYVSGKPNSAFAEGETELSSKATYKPTMYVGSGTSYSEVSWPPDAWRVDVNGAPDSGFRDSVLYPALKIEDRVGFTRGDRLRTALWSFGVGCLAVPVFNSDDGWRMLITHDSGGSWHFRTLHPGIGSVTPGGPDFAVLKPYVNSGDKGRIVFPVRVVGTQRVEFVETDGDFTEYKVTARTKQSFGTFPASIATDQADQIIYFGGDLGREYVFPMFPGEFEPD